MKKKNEKKKKYDGEQGVGGGGGGEGWGQSSRRSDRKKISRYSPLIIIYKISNSYLQWFTSLKKNKEVTDRKGT